MATPARLSLGTKALLMLLLPLAGLTWFTFDTVSSANQVVRESERQILFTQIAGFAGAVIHETQKERGLTSGALSPRAAEFREKLVNQRLTRDESLVGLKTLAATADTDLLGAEVTQALEEVLSFTDAIKAMRGMVDQRAVTQADAVSFYIGVVDSYVRLVSLVPKLSSDRGIARIGSAYTAIVRAKEGSGLERNLLGSIFAADQLSAEAQRKLLQGIRTQDIYRSEAVGAAPDEIANELREALLSQDIVDAEAMRLTVLSSDTGNNFGVNPVSAFTTQTKKVDALKKLEDWLLTELTALAEQKKAAAEQGRMTALILGLLAMMTVVLAIIWNFIKFRQLQTDLGGEADYLNAALDALGRSDFSMDLSTQAPATGVLAGLQSMKSKLEAQVEKDRRIVAESNRIREALDNVDSAALIFNDSMQIVFANRAATQLFDAIAGDPANSGARITSTELVGAEVARLPGHSDQHRDRLQTLNGTTIEELQIGSRTIKVVSNPVIAEDGTRLGAIATWEDRTLEVNIEKHVDDLVHSARNGDLSQRLDTDNVHGFFASLSEGLNSLITVAEQVVDDNVRVFSAVAQGDLRETIDRDYQGSYAQLKADANATIEKLTEVIGSIQLSAASVKGGAREIAIGNTDLQQRTEEQASGLEKTAQNMKRLTEMVKTNASSASEADQVARGASTKARKGGEVVNAAVDAMQEINDASRKISDIISVIDEIAFQTNLLALNAAVEAARAGEQGRGFAVVATEVRNLASRSASAAKEIKTLIQDSTAKVEEGTRLVDESGKTLEEIVDEVQRLTGTVEEIARSSQEQYEGIDEVNATIEKLDAFTQQNAAMVEQASAASESLGEQAATLDQLAAFFKTHDSESLDSVPFDHADPGSALEEVSAAAEGRWSNAAVG